MTGKVFLDSNVWIYLLTQDEPDKRQKAKEFVDDARVNSIVTVSWQVVNEVCVNLLRKKGRDEPFVRFTIDFICGSCEVVDFTAPLLESASDLRTRHSVSFWDSLIVSAALSADCDFLVSEDMQDGKKFGKLRVKNIFG
ncbi:MAG: PIN domain-containing protein [Verrucomicrobiota bacterium]|jgi:predicted nucleic acid-binding protein|nr:PIN domain-containing protein [Verrucomicrobiota bacterium]